MQRRGLWLYLVLLASFLVYAPSIRNDFTWDDRWAAMGHTGGVAHPLVSELRPLGEYFNNHYWPHKTPVSQTYRPITTLSFALRHAAFGDDPVPAHLANVVLHVLAVALLFLLILRLKVDWPVACAAALVFGLHAVHSEAVANVVGRAEMLGFCFGAGGLLLLNAACGRGWRGRWLLGLPAVLMLFCAFHSKESALAWAAFAPLYLMAGRLRRGEGAIASPTAATGVLVVVAVPAAAYLAMRFHALAQLPGAVDPSIGYLENPLLGAELETRLLTGVLLWGYGLLVTLLPFDLAADYGPNQLPLVTSTGDPWFAGTVLAGVAILAVLAAGLYWWRRRPLVFLAAASFLGFSLIVTNLPLPVFMMFAERTYYAPSLGLSLVVVAIAERVIRRHRVPPVAVIMLGAWLGASAFVAFERNSVWRNDETLILSEVRQHPRSVRMQLCAGDLWRGRGDTPAARQHFERAAALDPASPDAWLEVARVRLDQGDVVGATQALASARAGRARDRDAIAAELEAMAQRIAR